MVLPVSTTLDFGNTRRITGLPAATDTGQPVTFEQLNSAIEGLNWKDNVRVDATVNVSLAAPGASINGIAMAAGDRWLARTQTAPADNGIYIWNGASTPATRALDANAWDELKSAVVVVDEGPNAGSVFRQTAVTGTLGTTGIVWASFLPSAPVATETVAGISEIATQAETDAGTDDVRAVTPKKLAAYANRFKKSAATIGDGAATLYTVTHNFGTRDLQVTVSENSGLYRQVLVEVRLTTANAIDVVFDTAPAANSYRVVIEA